MSKFGWSLPPGVSTKDLPGNSPAEQAEESFFDKVYDQLPATMLEDDKAKIAGWVWEQVSIAYGDGYQQAKDDNTLAAEYVEAAKTRAKLWNEAADYVTEEILKEPK